MPALTAAAAAAAIAQMSLHPCGLLPQLAPYLQSYLPPTTQHLLLQQQLLQDHTPNSTLSPSLFPFAKAALLSPGMARSVTKSLLSHSLYISLCAFVMFTLPQIPVNSLHVPDCSLIQTAHLLCTSKQLHHIHGLQL